MDVVVYEKANTFFFKLKNICRRMRLSNWSLYVIYIVRRLSDWLFFIIILIFFIINKIRIYQKIKFLIHVICSIKFSSHHGILMNKIIVAKKSHHTPLTNSSEISNYYISLWALLTLAENQN